MEGKPNKHLIQPENPIARFAWEYVKADRIAGFDFEKMVVLVDASAEPVFYRGKRVYHIEPLTPEAAEVIRDAFLGHAGRGRP